MSSSSKLFLNQFFYIPTLAGITMKVAVLKVWSAVSPNLIGVPSGVKLHLYVKLIKVIKTPLLYS